MIANTLTVQGTYNTSQYLFLLLLVVVFPGLVWAVSALLSRNTSKLTGHATVKSHRVARDTGWLYLVCFELGDGSPLELLTTIGDYQALIDGQSGQLTWENNLFYHFDPDAPQERRNRT